MRRWRRWIALGVVGLLVLAVLAIAAVQVVLWSDWPRQQAEAGLREQLGLDVRIGSLSVGWFGRSVAEDVRVGLPLEDEPLAELPTVRLRHTSVPRLLTGADLAVHTLGLERPKLAVRQRADGRWNLERAFEVIAARQRPEDPTKEPLELPAVRIREATVEVQPAEGEAVRVTDLSATGRRVSQLAYTFELSGPAVGQIAGSLATVAPYGHEVTFDVAPAADLLRALTGASPGPAVAGGGRWTGQFDAEAVRGRLTLASASGPGVRTAAGTVDVRVGFEEPTVTVAPIDLAVEPADVTMPAPVRATAGHVRWQGDRLTFDRLRLAAFDGAALIDGTLDPTTLTGELSAIWDQLALPAGTEHTGRLTVHLTRPGPTNRRITATLEARSQAPGTPWQTALRLDATGPRWSQLSGTVIADTLRFTEPATDDHGEPAAPVTTTQAATPADTSPATQAASETVTAPATQPSPPATQPASPPLHNLDGLVARFTLDAPTVHLNHLRLDRPGDTQLTGEALLNWQTRDWSADLTGQALPLPGLPVPVAQLSAQATGNAEQITLNRADLEAAGVELAMQGTYVFRDPEPLRLDIHVREAPVRVGEAAQPLVRASNLTGQLTATGTLEPLQVTATGQLTAVALQVRGDTLGDIALQVRGRANGQRLTLGAEAVEWLGGSWVVRAQHDRPTGRTRVFVDARQIDLALADRLIAERLALEVGTADVSLWAENLGGSLDATRMEATFTASNIARPPLTVDQLKGQATLVDGQLRVHDVTATYGEGTLHGGLMLALAEPNRVRFDATLDRWPITLAGQQVGLRLTGGTAASLDLAARQGQGVADLTADVVLGQSEAGAVRARLALDGSVLNLQSLTGQVLQGQLEGEARVDLANLVTSQGTLRWRNLALQQLGVLARPLGAFRGGLDGKLIVSPAEGRRAIGPIRIELAVQGREATFRDLPVEEVQAVAFADPDQSRYVLRRLTAGLLGGRARIWGRVTRHEDRWYLYGNGELDTIDLAALTTALRPTDEPLLGRLSAELTVSTPLHNWQAAFGRGSLTLRESDLVSIPLFSELYALVNAPLAGFEPDGAGDARFRIDDGVLLFDRFQYRNRGVEMRLVGRVLDLWQGMDSPVRGYAVVSLRPLPDVELLEVINEALAVLQAEVASVRLEGTLREPQTIAVPLPGLQEAIGRLFGGSGDTNPHGTRARPTDPAATPDPAE